MTDNMLCQMAYFLDLFFAAEKTWFQYLTSSLAARYKIACILFLKWPFKTTRKKNQILVNNLITGYLSRFAFSLQPLVTKNK